MRARLKKGQQQSHKMLMSTAAQRYMFFNSFGGAEGMRVAVHQTVVAERARMQAIQDAILGPLETRYAF